MSFPVSQSGSYHCQHKADNQFQNICEIQHSLSYVKSSLSFLVQDKLTAKVATAPSFISGEVEEVMKARISSAEAVLSSFEVQ